MSVKPSQPAQPAGSRQGQASPATKPTSAPAAPAAPAGKPADEKKLNELTAQIAFELYEKRGKDGGRDQEDWFTAEKVARERLAGGKS